MSIALIYREMLKTLQRGGIRKPETMTPYEFSSLVRGRGAREYRLVQSLTERFVDVTYAGRSITSSDLEELKKTLGELESSLPKRKIDFQRVMRKLSSFISSVLS
jgi:hypothetical protein